MSYKYTKFGIFIRKNIRKIFPVAVSPWTKGETQDICRINLVPPKKLENFFKKCIKKLVKIKGENIGDYLEFGVFNGSSIGSSYIAHKELHIENRFFGFDAFEGLPKNSEKEDDGVWEGGFYKCSFDDTLNCLNKRGIDTDNINWVKGWYNKTLNNTIVNKYNFNNFGIIFIDCDTYSSSKTVLDFIGPLIKQPLIICFDDWKLNNLDIKGLGEYKAFNEFIIENNNFKIKEMCSYNRKSKTFLIEIKK